MRSVSGSVLNVEASDLAILKAKDLHHSLVLQPVSLILQGLAFEIADGLLGLHDDRAICGLSGEVRKSIYRPTHPGAKVRTPILFQSRLKSWILI
jgi:hypothetical protein